MKTTRPEWLDRWLNLSFYEGNRGMCEKHPKKFNTVYCGSCNQDPVCLTCWKFISHQHVGDRHQVLEVLKASRRVAIDVRKMRKNLDVSAIQIYSINGNDIVFLNPNEEGAPNDDVKPNCRTCRRRLIKDQEKFGYRFCSIACKYPRNEGGDLKKEKKSKDEEKSIKITLMIKKKLITINDECCPASASASLRKRSRKGIPCRAPFM